MGVTGKTRTRRGKSKMETMDLRRDHPDVRAYLQRLAPEQRRVATHLRALIRDEVPDVREGILWAIPFYWRKHPFCYVSPAKRHVTLGFPLGVGINDATGLLTGTGKSTIRKAVLKLKEDVPEEAVRDWLQQAIAIDDAAQEDGT
ncbi:MAG TPA: DUF1801 domain-containing protein [Candidatus Thermoplasmatota archaeon]|nr:DUF1801 domain-containing protein [Candidatus Thermoplasmatota archaeon]